MPVSKALEVNLKYSRVEVVLDPKYNVLQEVVAEYFGVLESLRGLLKEVCHPYKNWQYIVSETRRFALNHFPRFKTHPKGPQGSLLLAEIFLDAAKFAKTDEVKAEALDDLLAYVKQIVAESGDRLPDFIPVLADVSEKLVKLRDDEYFHLVKSFYQFNRIASDLAAKAPEDADLTAVDRALHRFYRLTYEYFLSEPDPRPWFEAAVPQAAGDERLAGLFEPVSHQQIQANLDRLKTIHDQPPGRDRLVETAGLPGHRDMVARYEKLPGELAKVGADHEAEDQWLLISLFHIMGLSGLTSIHEGALRRINRTLAGLIDREETEYARDLIHKTFVILEKSARTFPRTAFNTIFNMGQAVYRTDETELVETFIDAVIDLGFQTPNLKGVGDDWQVRANEAHIQNIRAWLALIELNPRWSKRLLSALIINLSLYGVFIKDTDLFPRDITGLLNADIAPVYNLVKQLCRLFPAYFNEIGAEGRLRDISTQIDEVSGRRDPLVHYLRKQSHVESSPQTVVLMEAIFEFWRTLDKTPLKELVPQDIYEGVQAEGPLAEGMHRLVGRLYQSGAVASPRDLLPMTAEELNTAVSGVDGDVDERDRQRLSAAHELYQKLHHKYHAGLVDLQQRLDAARTAELPPTDDLQAALGQNDRRRKLAAILDYLAELQGVILSPQTFEVHEDIYYKRHIAADIPSMYGSYHEAKFDALGLTFRLEALANSLLKELMDDLNLELITRADLNAVSDLFSLMNRALKIDGVDSQELDRQIDLLNHSLSIRGFSYTQYLDIFRGFSTVISNIVNDHFNNVHQNRVGVIVDQQPLDRLLAKFTPKNGGLDERDQAYRVTEIFLRDVIAGSLGVQQLDGFIGRIHATVFRQDHDLPPQLLRVLLNYDPGKAFTPINPVKKELADVIQLGAKGYNLVKLTELGLPVPKGFIITTEVFRCREVIDLYQPAKEQFQKRLARHIKQLERMTGLAYGDPDRPLLLSVRSGSSISQPGMLSTYLDVGINEDVAEGMGGDNDARRWFAWDSYRRFLQTYGMSMGGLLRDDFDALMADMKQQFGLPYKREFTGRQMRQTALYYKTFIQDQGVEIEERPFEQLYQAIGGVFASWDADRARAYRKIMGISNDWGTAVTVQQMVFGNLSLNSGSGVFFTHNPRWSGERIMLWGDFALSNQGEDVVSGLVETLPINQRQAELEKRPAAVTLETHFPDVYDYILQTAHRMIEQWGYGPQEMEFTFESPSRGDFYFLQSRDMALRERPTVYSFDLTDQAAAASLGRGIGVSGGGVSGRLVFSLEDIRAWRDKDPTAPLILVRGDTAPDDIKEIFEADGLLTARGGSTSHAAIVAHRLNKTCVVGCADLICDESTKTCRLGEARLGPGDWVSIDGLDGAVYLGQVGGDMKVKERRTV